MFKQPFSLQGARRDVAVLVIHGFTGHPGEVRPLGAALAEMGYTVRGILLPGHGSAPDDLRGIRWQQWAEHAADELRALQRSAESVFVCGLSMGGLLALHLAANVPGVRGAVAMSAPARLNHKLARLVPLAKYVVPWFGALDRADFSSPRVRAFVARQLPPGITIDFDDPAQIAEVKRAARLPLAAVDELMKLNKHVVGDLQNVHVPVMLAQGRNDTTIAPKSAEILVELVGAREKSVRWYENSGHMLPLEADAPQLFRDIAQFVSQLVPG